MGIFINGKMFNGSKITIINGRIISGGNMNCEESKKIDEQKSTKANNISQIHVNSDFANIILTPNNSDSESVDAHLSGNITTDGNTEFEVNTSGNEIQISAKLTGNYMNGDLTLNIAIPAKMFDKITVINEDGNITLDKGINSKTLVLKTQNGNVHSSALFESINAKSMNGNVKLCVNANSDIKLNASTLNGNARVELHNISQCNLSASTDNGIVKNRFTASKGYVVNGKVSSMNGDVKIT